MASTMMLSRCNIARPCAAPRLAVDSSVSRLARPASLQSQLTPVCTSLRSVTSSFAGCSLNTTQRTPVRARFSFLVQAKNHGSMACTLQGSRKRKIRTSGFRARRITVGGRKVIQNRRKKGRHIICTANNSGKK